MNALVDANILLYAKFSDFPQHAVAHTWLDAALNRPDPLALPWVSLMAFLRIATNPRILGTPLATAAAMAQLEEWTARRNVWAPEPGPRFARILGELVIAADARGNLAPDAYLAALAVEHGLVVASSDADFARFPGVRWVNPCTT